MNVGEAERLSQKKTVVVISLKTGQFLSVLLENAFSKTGGELDRQTDTITGTAPKYNAIHEPPQTFLKN